MKYTLTRTKIIETIIIETRAYNIAHDENAMSSKIYISVRSKAATSVL